MLESREIRVTVAVDPPFAFPCFSSLGSSRVCRKPGLEVEYVYILLGELLGYRIKWVKAATYDEMNEHIVRGMADVTGIGFSANEEISSNGLALPTAFFLTDTYMLLVKDRLEQATDPFHVFRIFSGPLWAGLLCLTAALTLSTWLIGLITKSSSTNFWSIQNVKGKLLVVVWMVLLGLLMSVFTNIMSIDLVIKKEVSEPPFQTFEEFQWKLRSGECKWVVLANYVNDNEVYVNVINPPASSPLPWAKGFHEAFKINQPLVVESREEVAEAIITTNKCLVGIDYISLETFYGSRFCGLRTIKEMPMSLEEEKLGIYAGFQSMRFSLILGQNSTFFMEKLTTLLASSPVRDLYQLLIKKYYQVLVPPDCKSASAAPWSPIPLSNTAGSFILFVFGAGSACVYFLWEYFQDKHQIQIQSLGIC